VRGVVVLFGTGSYYRKGDGGNSDPKNDRIPHPSIINAFYGIWDRRDGTSNIERSHLLKQQILGKAVAGTYDVRVTTNNPINWHLGTGKPTTSDPPTHLGWYLELRQPLDGAGEGELQVTNPQARSGRIIFTTLIPADTTTELCDFGGDGWLMELNALTGGRMTEVVFDLNADTYFNAADLVTVREQGTDVKRAPSGKKSLVGIIQEPAIISAGTKEYKYTSGAREAAIEVTLENPGDPERGRRAWMQLQ
jgi:type IV pilus assembly protein PilY1